MPTPPPRSDRDRGYRVELREGGYRVVLARDLDVPPQHTALEPIVARLVIEGARGEVVLVEQATGAVVARRRLSPGLSRWAGAGARDEGGEGGSAAGDGRPG